MSTIAALKNNIHELVVNTRDIEILEMVEIYFQSLVSNEDWWDKTNSKERQLIHKGMKDIQEGRVLSNEEVRNQLNKRLRRK